MAIESMLVSELIVSARSAAWAGISVSHYTLMAGVIPEHAQRKHLLLLPFGDLCKADVTTAGGVSTSGVRTQGAACIIPSNHSFSAEVYSQSENLAIYLDPELVSKAANQSASGFELLERVSPSDPVITTIAHALVEEIDGGAPAASIFAESLANVLAVHLLRHYSRITAVTAEVKGGLPRRVFKRVIDYIHEQYAGDLHLEELAGVAGMSTYHFAREFKRTSGKSPHQFVLAYRVERARELLRQSELSIVEVGLQTGFGSQSHFTRHFRKATGVTPLAFRDTKSS